MTSFRVRPRFKHPTDKSSNEIFTSIQKKLDLETAEVSGIVHEPHATLRIVHRHQHFWSPQLALYYDDMPEGKYLRGRYGPHPTIWVFFTMGYAIIGLLLFFAATVGFVRMSLKLSFDILWALPILLIAAVVLYLVAQTGQKMGVEQTFTLHHFVEESIGEKIHIS